ncbi:DUF6223 family protein [Haloglycomyces albus]|uniref:DUF6223 family protein n=1 Tax=Haloglycomyces albus TaxID=526067 RepID=UPI00046D4CC9|nr:DUF6223 family protein [Haloglycomyces albus]
MFIASTAGQVIRRMLAVSGMAVLGLVLIAAASPSSVPPSAGVGRSSAGSNMVAGRTAPVSMDVSQGSSGPLGFGVGREWAFAALILVVTAAVVSMVALRGIRRHSAARVRTLAWSAVGLSVVGMVVAALHAYYSAGGYDTGNGKAGADIALVVGAGALAVAGIAVARARTV